MTAAEKMPLPRVVPPHIAELMAKNPGLARINQDSIFGITKIAPIPGGARCPSEHVASGGKGGFSLIENLPLPQAAEEYAQRGIPIFPCSVEKKPLTPHGFKGATSDKQVVREWWRNNPNAWIGIPTGAVTGIFVLDVDNPDGPQSLAKLEEMYGLLPPTLQQRTGRGGRHLIFKHPGGAVKNSVGKIGKNLDIRGDGGYIIVSPSPGYTLIDDKFTEDL